MLQHIKEIGESRLTRVSKFDTSSSNCKAPRIAEVVARREHSGAEAGKQEGVGGRRGGA